jgi:hypothetical protein
MLSSSYSSLLLYCSPDKCKVMDSKMRPLWFNFNNLDPLGDQILQIFKNGDGMFCIIIIVC